MKLVVQMIECGAAPSRCAELPAHWQSATGEVHAKPMGNHVPFAGNNDAAFLAAKGQA